METRDKSEFEARVREHVTELFVEARGQRGAVVKGHIDLMGRSYFTLRGGPAAMRFAEYLDTLPGFSDRERSAATSVTNSEVGALVMTFAKAVCSADLLIDETVWPETLDLLRARAFEGKLKRLTTASLVNLEVEDRIDLGVARLRPVADQERSALAWGVESGMVLAGPDKADACVEIETFETVRSRSPEPYELIDAVLLALWLIGLEDVRLAGVHERRGLDPWQTVDFKPIHHVKHQAGNVRDPGQLIEVFRWVREAQSLRPKGLASALRRFRLIHEHPRADDLIVDQVIVLEALFKSREERGDLAYRLRLRAAHFLGESLAERKRIFDVLKDLYERRSALAHGGSDRASDQVAARDLSEVLRLTLLKFVRLAAEIQDTAICSRVCDELDSRVLERAGDGPAPVASARTGGAGSE